MADLIAYSENTCSSESGIPFEQCLKAPADGALKWINIEHTDGNDFSSMVSLLELHHLMVEDMKNRAQLPKFEAFDDTSFLSVQMVRRHAISKEVFTEHLSILIRDQ